MDEHVLFGDFVERWLCEVAPVRYKPTAVTEYESLLRRHVLPQFGRSVLSEISTAEVQQFVARQVEKGFAPRSVLNQLVVLRSVFRSAVAFGLVESNPATKAQPPRHQRREQRFLTPSELSAALSATPDAWKSLIALPIYSAGRKGEVLALRWPQVSFERRQIAFIRSMRAGVEYTVKTPASRASVVMASALVPLLQKRRERCFDPENGYVFGRSDGNPLDDGTPGRVLHRACIKAGIEPCTFHQLRHSAIAAVIAQGAHPLVVSRFARHASVETTLDVYGHLLSPLAGGGEGIDLSNVISAS